MITNPDPKHGRWILPLVILGMVGLTVLFVNSLEPAVSAEDTTTTTAGGTTATTAPDTTGTTNGDDPGTTTTTASEEVAAYLTKVDDWATTATDLLQRAELLNSTWDNTPREDRDFQATLAQFREIQAETEALRDSVQQQTPPAGYEDVHADLVTAANNMAAAAADMEAGLRASDTGEARRAALVDYQSAATEFATAIEAIRNFSPTA